MSWTAKSAANGKSTAGGVTGSPESATASLTVAAGDLILVAVGAVNYQSGFSCSDSAGNTYTQRAIQNAVSSAYAGAIFSATAATAGPITITGASTLGSATIVAFNASCAGTPTFVASAEAAAASTTFATGNLAWTGNALLFAALIESAASGGWSISSPFSAGAASLDETSGFAGVLVGYDVNNTSSPTNPTFITTNGQGASALAVAFVEVTGPTTATLSGPTSGAVGQQSTAYTVTLNAAATAAVTVTPSSSVPGDTFQATAGGGNVAAITIAAGSSTGTFYLTPIASAAGNRNISITASPTLTYSGSPAPYDAIGAPPAGYVQFDSWVSGLPSGAASSATAVPRAYNGSSIGSISSSYYFVGPIVESSDDPGAYGCRVAVAPAQLPAGSTLRVAWTVGGTPIVDPSPQPASNLLDGGLSWGQALNQVLAGLAGILGNVPTSGAGTLYFGGAGTSSNNRIAMGVDGSGNRTSIAHTPPVA
jgi:hypothetical protein